MPAPAPNTTTICRSISFSAVNDGVAFPKNQSQYQSAADHAFVAVDRLGSAHQLRWRSCELGVTRDSLLSCPSDHPRPGISTTVGWDRGIAEDSGAKSS